MGSTLAETLLGIETRHRQSHHFQGKGSTLAETLLGIETRVMDPWEEFHGVPLWLKPF